MLCYGPLMSELGAQSAGAPPQPRHGGLCPPPLRLRRLWLQDASELSTTGRRVTDRNLCRRSPIASRSALSAVCTCQTSKTILAGSTVDRQTTAKAKMNDNRNSPVASQHSVPQYRLQYGTGWRREVEQTPCSKKGTYQNSVNHQPIFELFHCQILQHICSTVFIKDSTAPHMRRCTTL